MKQLKKSEVKKLFKGYKKEGETIVVLENVEYARNVAGIFRTLDAAGVRETYLTGITVTPPFGKDLRKASRSKEDSVRWIYQEDTNKVITKLKKQGYKIIGVELTDNGMDLKMLAKYNQENPKLALVFGSEVFGIKKTTLEKCDATVFIPMYGKGASLNVGVSVGIVLYSL